ncbi:MAG: FAD-dependent oxidoreductase, partial [Eggerthellaceae bacterium]|nr:FAD-dependent oxidoreductase [Eggerthellaceae bacterium]
IEKDSQHGSQHNSHHIGRREFLGGSLVLGAGLVGATAFGSVKTAAAETPAAPAPLTPGTTGLKQEANFPYEVLDAQAGPNAQPIPPLAVPASWDEEADVVIIGTGAAGLAATLYLTLKGQKVITVEKNPFWGGVSSPAGAWVIKGGTKAHAAAGYEFDIDGIVDLSLSRQPYPAHGLQRKITRQIVVRGAEAMDWFIDLGAPMKMVHPQSYQSIGPDGSSRASNGINFAYDLAVEKGADIRLETPCVGLVKDGDRIVGIKATDLATSREYFIKGKRAVLVCSGGFGGNFDMLARWCPSAAQTVPMTSAFPGDDGALTRMGMGAGCGMNGWDSFCTFDGGIPDVGYFHRIREGDVQLARQPWLGIDITGNRYPYSSYYDQGWGSLEIAAKVLSGLPQHTAYVFFDANWEKNTHAFAEGGCRKPETEANTPRSMVTAIDPEDWLIGVQRSLDRGHIKTANNITDLAKEMGLNPDVVNKAVMDWNAMCEAGVDPEFDYKPNWLVPISTPPYYSMRLTAQLLATHCGLMINEKHEALDEKGQVMPGFYVASMTAGGMVSSATFGDGRVSPNGMLFLSFCTGYIAAQSILGELD